ncbi:uncharacterized protein UBRO_20212 [Ustilago bromivora]|uniref:Uncharacterized protein n=1 Tax=Ustilago bromivora TaxID=307758 RepID=A0A1K0FVD7_9BASI|nr:uncharacterized protein UBRO_20212 [Ustilago bromivora]
MDEAAVEVGYVSKNLLGKHLPVPKPRDELARAAEEVWNTQITLEHINPVIESMEHCVEQVFTKHGGHSSISWIRDSLQSKALLLGLLTVCFAQPDTYETSVLQADGRYAIG